MGNFSKFGFILATLGSSIGLGHIWRFPYMVGQMGGGAFVLLFLVMTLFIGVAMLVGEMLMGNKTQKNTVDTFIQLDPNPKKPWRFAGLTLIGGPIILAFYAVVLGWVVYYLVGVSVDLPDNAQQADQIYGALLTSRSFHQILGFTSVLGFTGLIVSLGIKNGIEKLNLVLMPLLFIIFIGYNFISSNEEWKKEDIMDIKGDKGTIVVPVKADSGSIILYVEPVAENDNGEPSRITKTGWQKYTLIYSQNVLNN